ncbi:MAG: Gfo/Idh/MocA family oxidoreductase [Proteobacteria bacterium]|nr:Gfo/Idh/MocA family oxidoreductase [Pseudomonadota bacterium]MBS0574485.1 Gfo/Idh/MocA family oxidoreductase [Pseudomonadota bacterium]
MKIGIIGAAGKIGQMRVETVRANPRCTLAAVMDLAADKAAALAGGAPAFSDLDRFLDQKMDAVIISTPSHVREPLCLAAFARGLHVLSEKPLAQNLASARRIVEAARAAKRHLGGGFNMRYYPAFAHVKDVVASGRIGEVDHVRVYGGHGGLSNFTHDWEYKAEFSGGGALWDVGIHMTDMARHILGEITEVYGVATSRVWNVPGSEDNAMAIYKSPSGVSALYQATWTDWKGYQSAIEVYGTRGMVRGAYAPMHTLTITQDRPGGTQRREVNGYFGVKVREKLKSWKVTAVDAFAGELDDFISLTEGREGLRIADGHAALRAIEVATMVPESSRTGQPVQLENLGPMRL